MKIKINTLYPYHICQPPNQMCIPYNLLFPISGKILSNLYPLSHNKLLSKLRERFRFLSIHIFITNLTRFLRKYYHQKTITKLYRCDQIRAYLEVNIYPIYRISSSSAYIHLCMQSTFPKLTEYCIWWYTLQHFLSPVNFRHKVLFIPKHVSFDE